MAAIALAWGHGRKPVRAEAPWSTTAARCEVKYWASEAQAAALLRVASPHVTLDPHASRADPRGAWNVSLYLDSARRHFFEQHLAAAPDRVKLRVRTYAAAGDAPDAPAFLEIKRKVGALTLKRRTVVTRADALAIADHRFEGAECLRRPPGRDLEAFLFLQERYAVRPALLVRARRRSFVGADDADAFRLTLDRDIGYQRVADPDLVGRPRAWTVVDLAGPVLVELKFCHAAPAWVGPALERLGLVRNAFSKYVAALAQDLGLSSAAGLPGGATVPYGAEDD
jgi:hypothetical protein